MVRRQKEEGWKEGSEGGEGREVMNLEKRYFGSPMWLLSAIPETNILGSGSWGEIGTLEIIKYEKAFLQK